MTDFSAIRTALASLPSDHDATGMHRPTVGEIFTPVQHANALDPNTPIVVGARGAGKSFWAGVLGQDETRRATASAYPHLGLERVIVRSGYSGLPDGDGMSSKTIDSRVSKGSEAERAPDFWQAVIIGAARSALKPNEEHGTIREIMEQFADPEDAAREFKDLDRQFTEESRTLLVTFDAVDTFSREWIRSSLLVNALFEVVWELRARKSIRAKIFIRPEQLNDETLRFVELPKLRSGRVELEWTQTDLYGLLFWRMAAFSDPAARDSFAALARQSGATVPPDAVHRRRNWLLLDAREVQKPVMDGMSGLYMGQGHKKGGTYDWPYNHLGDAVGQVTPRSFVKLFREAAKFGRAPDSQVLSPEGIRHGLREASKDVSINWSWSIDGSDEPCCPWQECECPANPTLFLSAGLRPGPLRRFCRPQATSSPGSCHRFRFIRQETLTAFLRVPWRILEYSPSGMTLESTSRIYSGWRP